MGARIRDFDWAGTPLGPVADWSAALQHTLHICLESKHPIFIGWGADFRLFYNDVCIPILGGKHPTALGRSAREVWAEIREEFVGQMESVFATGAGSWYGDRCLSVMRDSFLEETYFSYSLSPVRARGGALEGIFIVITETTTRSVGERRLRTVREVSERTFEARTEHELLQAAARAFALNRYDLPFSLIYRMTPERGELKAAHGLSEGQIVQLENLDLRTDPGLLLARAVREGPIHAARLETGNGAMPGGVWRENARDALILPIGDGRIVDHVLVAGISPRRPLDNDYRSFLELLAVRIGKCLGRARELEAERQQAQKVAEALANARLELRSVSDHLITAQEEESGRIARELHDDVGQRIAMLGIELDQLAAIVPQVKGTEPYSAAHENMAALGRDIRAISHQLHPSVVADLGLAPALRQLVQQFNDAGGHASFVDRGEVSLSDPLVETPLYRIAQEALRNVMKHAPGALVRIALTQRGSYVRLSIRDSGPGFNPEAVRGQEGMGLLSMRERARLIGATLMVLAKPGAGTLILVRVPTHPPQA